jgi:hypothetical protein
MVFALPWIAASLALLAMTMQSNVIRYSQAFGHALLGSFRTKIKLFI